MRQVIYILLVVNAAYFSWNTLRDRPREEGGIPVRQMPVNLRQLESIRERAAQSATATESVRDPGGDAPVIDRPRKNAEAPRESIVQPETAEFGRVEALNGAQPRGAHAPAHKCHVLGPFRDDREMKKVERRLNQLGYKPKERAGETRIVTGYWVYLPAMEREEVLRITRMLDEKKDRDHLIVKGNAVSLGVYDGRARADLRVEMLRKYGLDPVVEPRYETRSGHWLDLDLPNDGRAIVQTMRDAGQNLHVQESACL
jgi:hypothetical protein